MPQNGGATRAWTRLNAPASYVNRSIDLNILNKDMTHFPKNTSDH